MKSRFHVLLVMIVFAVVLAFGGHYAVGQAMMMGFDTDSSGNPITSGMKLTSVWASMGMTITKVGPGTAGGPSVYANPNLPSGFGTPPFAISIVPPPGAADFSENGFGMIQITWENDPPHSVCIGVHPEGPSDFGVIRAYDRAENKLQEKTSKVGLNDSICVDAFGMKSVRFAGAGNHYCRFDNLAIAGTGEIGPVGPYYLPAIARLTGARETNWRSDVEIFNRNSSQSSNITVALLLRDQANPRPVVRSYNIPPERAIRLNDVLGTEFGMVTGAATLRLQGTGGDPVFNGRTYNDLTAGTYGQSMEGLSLDQAIEPSDIGLLYHVSQSATDTDGYRTNLGLVNASPFSIDVLVNSLSADHAALGSKTYTLEPYESIQLNKWFRTDLGLGSVTDAIIAIRSLTPGAHFFGFVTVTDNKTGDSVYYSANRMRFRQ